MRGNQLMICFLNRIVITLSYHPGTISTLMHLKKPETFQSRHQLARGDGIKEGRKWAAKHRNHRCTRGQKLLSPDHPVHHDLGILRATQAVAATNTTIIYDLGKALVNLDGLDRACPHTGITASASLLVGYDWFHDGPYLSILLRFNSRLIFQFVSVQQMAHECKQNNNGAVWIQYYWR